MIEDQRLFDLVRHQRSELHVAELITDAEYAWLCEEGSTGARNGSRDRLETYDGIRHRLNKAEEALKHVGENHHEGEGEFNDIVLNALKTLSLQAVDHT